MISITNLTSNNSAELSVDSLVTIQIGTWDLYWQLSHADLKVEYIGDSIFIHSPASLDHERIFVYLCTKFQNYMTENKIGEVLGSKFPLKLLDGKHVEPDLMIISNQDTKEGGLESTVFTGIPSIIIEIVSPNYRLHDTEVKMKQYKELGVPEYWIIDPSQKEAFIYTMKDNYSKMKRFTEGILSPKLDILKDFQLDLKEIWSLLIKS